jgi:hypothetical protein
MVHFTLNKLYLKSGPNLFTLTNLHTDSPLHPSH